MAGTPRKDAQFGERGRRGFRTLVCALAAIGSLAFAAPAMAAAPNTVIDPPTPANPTNDTQPEFFFQATGGTDPPHTFECSINGAAFTPCSSGDTFNVPERSNQFRVRARNSINQADGSPAVFNWVVDTTPPNITSLTVPANKDRYVLHQSVTPVATCADPDPAGPAVPSGVPANCGPQPPVDTELPLGPKLYTANATDAAGNAATPVTHAYTVDPAPYHSFVLDDDPVAYYRLGEPYPSAQTPQEIEMLDSSGNDHHGTYKNNVALGRQGAIACARRPHPPRACEGKPVDPNRHPENKAAFFPERDGYGYVNGISASPTGYTMEAWVKPRTSGPMMVMSHGRAGQLFINDQQRLAFEQSQDTVASPGPNIPVGAWSHVAATWDGHNTRLFVNGVQVAHSTTANKEPSGTSTFYVGYGEKAPWFHGEIDEAALYDHALSAHDFEHRYALGTAKDEKSLQAGNHPHNTEGPFTDPNAPKNGGLYAPGKTPQADFSCTDPDDVPGNSDIASCTATVSSNGGPANPIANGATLPDALGSHIFTVTAVDESGNTYVHPHTYTVRAFRDIYLNAGDFPVAYYRLGEPIGAIEMFDSSPNGHDGEYKNDQDSSPFGVSGDGDRSRDFRGAGGYGYANGVPAPNYQTTLEAWIEPDNMHRDQSILGHGDGGEIFLEGGVLKFRHGPQNRVVSSSPPYAPNPNSTFTQVVGTWDGVDLRIYVNGQLEGTLESNRNPTSSSTFYVGYGELKPWFDGRIDEVAYYSTALNANRVLQHFLADPAADGADAGSGGGGGSGGGSGGDGSGGGDVGVGAAGDGGGTGSTGTGADGGEPTGGADDSQAKLEQCVQRALKITNKKKRRKAVKKCRTTYGAAA